MKRIISDLDGTLLKGSLILDFYGHCEKLGIIDTEGLYEGWSNDRKDEGLITQLAMMGTQKLKGKNMDELHIREYVDGYIYDKEFEIIRLEEDRSPVTDAWKDVFKLLAYEKDIEVLITTGSPSYLVEPFIKSMFYMHIPSDCKFKYDIIATEMEVVDNIFTGKMLRAGFTDKEKHIAKYLENKDYNQFDIGLGDTASDIPVFNVSKKSILVQPNIDTLINIVANKILIDNVYYK